MSRLWLGRWAYIFTDILTTLVALLCFNVYRYQIQGQEAIMHSLVTYLTLPNTLLSSVAALSVAVLIYVLSGYYNKPYAKSRMNDLVTSLYASSLLCVLVFLAVVSDDVMPTTNHYLRGYLILYLCFFSFLYLGRAAMTHVLLTLTQADQYRRRVLLVEEGSIGSEVGSWLEGEGQMHLIYRQTLPPELTAKDEFADLIKQIEHMARKHNAEELVIATTSCSIQFISQLLYALYPLGLPIKLSPRAIPYVGVKLRVDSMIGEPLVDITACNMSESSQNIKWLADRLMAAVGLLLLSPLMLYIAYRVRRDSQGPIFYVQERIGLHGRPFWIYKFRSMYAGAETQGPQLSQDGDERITPWGRIMRRYRLDELPQLWNVLRGDMSLVGPRPERAYYIRQLMTTAPQLYLLHNVRPGITSWAMVRYGYASSLEQMRERMAYDFLYYENMSLRLDILTLFYTIQTIAKGTGK